MTHTLPQWQLTHFRQHDECLLLLPLEPQPTVPTEFQGCCQWAEEFAIADLRDIDAGVVDEWTAPYQPGDVIYLHPWYMRPIRAEDTVVRKQVVSVMAKRAKEVSLVEAKLIGCFRERYEPGWTTISKNQWNADHPEHPWHESLWLWSIELRNAT